ncbi:MAG: sigma-54 dependent transcriptional regulator [Candidatus Competibacteraceae bacterium]
MKHYRLLIVDDEKEILRTLTLALADDYEVFTATSGDEALRILEKYDIALLIADQRMPGMTGVELLERVLHLNPCIIRMILTDYTEVTALIQAVNNDHIYQYITKPVDCKELGIIIKRALENYELRLEKQRLIKALEGTNDQLRQENTALKKEPDWNAQNISIIGQSTAMQGVFDLVDRVIDNAVTVLLTGETGTGKTLLARYIHYHGPRRDHLFVEQNCGALPESLLESELFGHKRGAFTGALTDQKGLFEMADGGTVFLDEISEMSPTMQVKLLQVLQEGRFRRVGDSVYRQVDVRIISATNKDLITEVQQGRFRSDLYYRIHVFPIHIPPLRERLEDIPLLAEYYLGKHRHKLNSQVIGLSKAVLQYLCRYTYPGNVRELENLIERGLLLSSGSLLEAGEWLPEFDPDTRVIPKLEQFERDEITRLLKLYRGNLTSIARNLGISRTTLWRRMKNYHIQPDESVDSVGQEA